MQTDAEKLDHLLQSTIGKITNGISPAALLLAFSDWYSHLLLHPAKQLELLTLYHDRVQHCMLQFQKHLCGDATGEFSVIPKAQDKRFISSEWQQFPFSYLYESFLFSEEWWRIATTNVHGVSKHHEEVVNFTLRQILDMFSPSNFPFINPDIRRETIESQGQNLTRGYKNFLDDLHRYQNNLPPEGSENFVIGENIATTPGNVIYQNRLMQLIQYKSETETVYAEPILITPAWIMKYYILDLTKKHSLVKYLVKKGHTVFMISWKNPDKNDSDLGMEDYLNLGIMSALATINKIIPHRKVHLVGYCLGGTLAAIAAATLARDNKDLLATFTLFAAQTDFTEPGELGLFIDESQIAFLENMMREKGYLDTHQMSAAFQLLRSNDLIWSRLIQDYFLGKRKPLTDLMAWNADATRLPYKMHSEYLRQLFLNNELAEGKYLVAGLPIALSDIRIPIFVVATERDHVSPWHSVFKINLLTDSDVTFTLTSGGHNVGIVSMPSKKTKRYFRVSTLLEKDRYIDADTWYQTTKQKNGSWWPTFEKWIAKHSNDQVPPPGIGNKQQGIDIIEDAPGTYVLQK